MVGYNKPLSVRLADEDSVFLATLQLDDATTASDKVRALIRMARQRAEAPDGYQAAHALSRDLLSPAHRAIRTEEDRNGAHSAVVLALLSDIEELFALALTAPADTAGGARSDLVRYEAKLVDRAGRITEHLLRWAVTPDAPAYDPAVVAERIAPLGELVRRIPKAGDPGPVS